MLLGAAGAVSGLAAALPGCVARLLREQEPLGEWIAAIRAGFSRFPFHAALKVALAAQGVPIEPAVRGPLRELTPQQASALRLWLSAEVLGSSGDLPPVDREAVRHDIDAVLDTGV
jgi:dihydrodipicolinate synthase/N-acetylneuraminate lyase